MADCHEDVKKRIEALYNMLVEHEGYGEMQIDFKILKKGQKRSLFTVESSIGMWLIVEQLV